MSKIKYGEEELNWLKFAYRDCSPIQFKFTFGLWVLFTISKLNEDASIRVPSLKSLHKILHLLDFETNKPLYQAWKQATDEIWKWRAKVLPEICEEVKARCATVYFAGSADISFKYCAEKALSPEDKCSATEDIGSNCDLSLTTVLNPKGKFAINPMGNMLFKFTKGHPKAEDFRDILVQLLLSASNPIILIVERSEIHKSELLKEFLKSEKRRLQLFYIPAPK